MQLETQKLRILTDSEADTLNLEVARALGWHFREDPEDVTDSYWTLPDGGMDDAPPFGVADGKHYGNFYVLPNFMRDAMTLGYLIEWAYATAVFVSLTSNTTGFSDWEARVWDYEPLPLSRGATPGEALGRAILAYTTTQ